MSLPHVYYDWSVRIHRNGIQDPSGSVDEFVYFGVDGDTTPQGKIELPVVLNETPEAQRERVRQALGRQDVHWW